MIEILSPLSKGLMQLMALSSIGLLITLAVLAIEVKGKIINVKLAVRSKKFLFAWLLSLFLFIIVQISYLLEQPLRNSLNPTVIRSYLTQTAIGKSYLIQLIMMIN